MFTFTYCRNIEMSAEKPLLENTLYIALKKTNKLKTISFIKYKFAENLCLNVLRT